MLSRILRLPRNNLIGLLRTVRHASDAPYNEDLLDNPPGYHVLRDDVQGEAQWDPKKESLEDHLCVWFGSEMPTINDEKSSLRDHKNFPYDPIADYAEPCRLHFIPDSWFQPFYGKTGVTGPYVFGTTFITFLISKEFFILESELLVGASLAFWTVVGVRLFGAKFRNKICASVDEESRRWDEWQQKMIQYLKDVADNERALQNSANDQKILFDAKRENIKLQLEAEFRRRQMVVYSEVKKRLDFQIAKQDAIRQFQQKHMVNWIIESVAKSITPQHEKEALQKCISDLKSLSAKYQIA